MTRRVMSTNDRNNFSNKTSTDDEVTARKRSLVASFKELVAQKEDEEARIKAAVARLAELD